LSPEQKRTAAVVKEEDKADIWGRKEMKRGETFGKKSKVATHENKKQARKHDKPVKKLESRKIKASHAAPKYRTRHRRRGQ